MLACPVVVAAGATCTSTCSTCGNPEWQENLPLLLLRVQLKKEAAQRLQCFYCTRECRRKRKRTSVTGRQLYDCTTLASRHLTINNTRLHRTMDDHAPSSVQEPEQKKMICKGDSAIRYNSPHPKTTARDAKKGWRPALRFDEDRVLGYVRSSHTTPAQSSAYSAPKGRLYRQGKAEQTFFFGSWSYVPLALFCTDGAASASLQRTLAALLNILSKSLGLPPSLPLS